VQEGKALRRESVKKEKQFKLQKERQRQKYIANLLILNIK
jgi:hypothetical protein